MATGKLVGTDAQYGGSDGSDYTIFVKFTAIATGLLSEIRIYSLASGHAKVAVYADSAGVPGSRLAKQDTSTAVTLNQWNTIALEASINVTAGDVLWLAVITDTLGADAFSAAGGISRYSAQTYSTWAWPSTPPSTIDQTPFTRSIAGWGIFVLSPSSISQPLSYGTPKLIFTIKPSSIVQSIVYGTPTVLTSALIIQPSSIVQVVAIGTPTLRYPQTLSPSSIVQPVVVGTPWVGIFGFIRPQSIIQQISIGSPTILKYVWHVILDGNYNIESPEVNRAYVIGQDAYGNPVYGTAVDATEGALVGERLDFQQEQAVPLTAQAASVAAAILSKMRITTKKGLILIPPNCGQELFDVVQISDVGANQAAVSFRVVGIRFEYNPKKAIFEHRLILGAP